MYGVDENIARSQFNESMRREFRGKEPFLDLADWESTRPDGSRHLFTDAGGTYEEMFDGYAADSGHLDAEGRQVMAARFLAFLASLPGTPDLAD